MATLLVALIGCGAPSDSETEEGSTTDESEAIAQAIEQELALLGGSTKDVERLRGIVEVRITSLEARKEKAKATAKSDIASYSDRQWERSWFRRDEVDAAGKARARDIFDRPERRALDAAEAQKTVIDAVLALNGAGRAGTLREPTPEAAALREQYLEVALSVALNGDLGLINQVGARILTVLRKKIFRFLREERNAEAANVGSDGDPIASTVWRRRSAAETTPAVLYRGPWYAGSSLPRLPSRGETWDLVELRSQKADGAHASVEIGSGDEVVKLKLHTDPSTGFWTEPAYARLLWAMGYETDPQYLLRDVRVQPRAFLAAHAAIARVGLKLGSKDDEVIPGRPPKGLSVALNGLSKAPGSGWVTVRYRDGREQGGDEAIASLRTAMDDRALMDSMDSVVVKRAYAELSRPGKWDAIGPWDYDTDNHIDDREVRSLGLIMVAWLGSDDLKFNNLRLDADRSSSSLKLVHVLADVGSEKATTALPWESGIRAGDRFLHPDTNAYTIKAFDRMTTTDAKWAAVRIGQLTEDQILACVAAGAFDDAALAVYVEKLLARRDEIIRAFGLTNELGLLRPNGSNRTPAPRHFTP